MIRKLWKRVGRALLCGIGLLALARVSHAQDGLPRVPAGQPQAPAKATLGGLTAPDPELLSRIEKLERQNQELMRALQHTSTQGGGAEGDGKEAKLPADEVKKIVKDYLDDKDKKKKTEDAAKKAQAEEEGYKVGSDLKVSAAWNEYGYLWLRSPNDDFKMHIGAWVQYDNVFWDQSPGLRALPGARPGPKQFVASGVAAGGIGDLQDGTYFRRIRPFFEGTLWEVFEYRFNIALENNQFNTAGLDEVWVAWNKIPGIGTVRVGHVKNAVGFEADMSGSSRTMTFMERSSYSEALENNENFVTGVWLHNWFVDEHMTYTLTAFRQDNGASSGAYFGDGQWGAQGRLTFLPLYECDGRHWLHLGISGGWRNGTSNFATSPSRLFQLRARPELRDDDPAAGGPTVIPNANSNRMVDTGAIAASDEYLAGLELCYVRGPFSIQAEAGANRIANAVGIAPAGTVFNPRLVPAQDYTFYGGYVQLAYTLTGEARAYDRKGGTLAREYFKTGPFTNAWVVRDEHGNFNWGLGAWELAARWSYINLNDGVGANRIQGGVMNGFSAAVNWYLNPNVTCMFDWVYDNRFDLPVGTTAGWTSGFGARVQLSF